MTESTQFRQFSVYIVITFISIVLQFIADITSYRYARKGFKISQSQRSVDQRGEHEFNVSNHQEFTKFS